MNVGDPVRVVDRNRLMYGKSGEIVHTNEYGAIVQHNDDTRHTYAWDALVPADTIGARLARPSNGDDAITPDEGGHIYAVFNRRYNRDGAA